jgi:hypothetical protein
MTPEAVEEFFARYAAAFSRGDTEEIGSLWKLPAFITAPERSVCFSDAAAFRANTDALCEFYRARGMARATAEGRNASAPPDWTWFPSSSASNRVLSTRPLGGG